MINLQRELMLQLIHLS